MPYGKKTSLRLNSKPHTMTSQQILQSDLLDILFEDRNKQYGAYQLRKAYPVEITKALILTGVSALVLLYLFRPSFAPAATNPLTAKEVVVDPFVPTEEKKPDTPKPPAAPQEKQRAFSDRIAIVQKDVPTEMPDINDLQDAIVSTVTTDGSPAGVLQQGPAIGSGPDEPVSAPVAPEPKKEIIPDKQPQFPGGMQAWLAFLSRNLYAPQDLEVGEKRTVLVRFYVAEDGSVTNFQVLQSAGSPFDNEVLRVLKKMPRWTPASKAGEPIAVSFTQPVTFVGMED
jgi:protein TonB